MSRLNAHIFKGISDDEERTRMTTPHDHVEPVDDNAAPESLDLSNLPSESLIVSTFQNSREKESAIEHLDELAQLVVSYGGEVLGKLVSPLKKPNARTYIGEGKVEEIAKTAEELKARLVVFDHELTPSQQRNLEEALGVSVADRTEIILGVFARHARSREAKLQIELAQIQHHMPRLKRLWTHLSRQRGGGVNQKGEGETQIEIDKRLLKRRLEFVKYQIGLVQKTRLVKAGARERSQIPSFAIVGYTNAGKSTLMNALTDASVLVEDKLFATLDTTTRKYHLPSGNEVLVIDTVGFIRKLPHLLVAAFRSTLQEAMDADILVHLIDGSHPQVHEHIKATEEVLAQLGAASKSRLIVFNKVDCMSSSQVLELKLRYGGSCFISSTTGQGIQELTIQMEQMLSSRRQMVLLKIPQDRFDLVTYLYQVGQVHTTEYIDNDVILSASLLSPDVSRLEAYRIEKDAAQTEPQG